MKKNITCKHNYMLEEARMKSLLKNLNKSPFWNRQKYEKKNTVSFFDDDKVCYFVLMLPDHDNFEWEMLDMVNLFGSWYGITACKVNGEWL